MKKPEQSPAPALWITAYAVSGPVCPVPEFFKMGAIGFELERSWESWADLCARDGGLRGGRHDLDRKEHRNRIQQRRDDAGSG
jgi:hypothetical protein